MVVPTKIDLSSPTARSDIIASVTSTLNPMFLVSIPTISTLAKSIITDIKDNQSERLKGVENQGRLELDERNKETKELIKRILKETVYKILNILSSTNPTSPTSLPPSLQTRNLKVDGILCMRYYPSKDDAPSSQQRLGSHCDGNMVTLLWSTRPGLQVPVDDGRVSPSQVKSVGVPTMGGLDNVGKWRDMVDGDWEVVETEDEDDVIVTIGNEWFELNLNPEVNEGVWCPVLHRVFMGGEEERWSMPYLARTVGEGELA
eukprot:CAMPEP_0118639022 /NCGR_PEP_ID=MMETSP0785-20121206/4004_1 /TAXON_ID=91992 /ORGANISM="Bolidomonas pacifica, Strain CCMP 1866" /LENGTH=259 /DNA_ID=CAMNT_0006530327 /DNA_START=18 /DNA_END=794 /DNA_ORIENTATION=-